jgi:hypothetical protein
MDRASGRQHASGDFALRSIYLYFYTDSVAFPRLRDQSLDQAWPFLLTESLRQELGVPVYPCLRGLGGGTIAEIGQILNRDAGYFRSQDSDTVSIVIFNTGVVDAAPQPVTYALRKIANIPKLGPPVWGWLQAKLTPHRALLQSLYSYRRTPPWRFSWLFDRMVKQAKRAGMIPVSIDTPLTPMSLERRSPGLRDSISLYNEIKHRQLDVMHVPTDWVSEAHFLECGHHLNQIGHRLLAEELKNTVLAFLMRQCQSKASV